MLKQEWKVSYYYVPVNFRPAWQAARLKQEWKVSFYCVPVSFRPEVARLKQEWKVSYYYVPVNFRPAWQVGRLKQEWKVSYYYVPISYGRRKGQEQSCDRFDNSIMSFPQYTKGCCFRTALQTVSDAATEKHHLQHPQERLLFCSTHTAPYWTCRKRTGNGLMWKLECTLLNTTYTDLMTTSNNYPL